MNADSFLVASRGAGAEHGLVRCAYQDDGWTRTTLTTIEQLSALAWHPRLPVVYGTAGVAKPGQVVAISVADGAGRLISDQLAGPAELEPCHLAVDPSGSVLIVTNYTSGQLACWLLESDGSLAGEGHYVQLQGSGPERERQEAAHPHQVVFQQRDDGIRAWVVDLGADLIREFEVFAGSGSVRLEELRTFPVPAGSGPRHLAEMPDGRLAITGELGSNLLVLNPRDGQVQSVPSTTRTGPARTRHTRNYPGDIQLSLDGRHVYFANRGYDTISLFDVSGEAPVLVTEQDSGVRWPQHILVREGEILVAGWDSSEVASLATDGGGLGESRVKFAVPGPGWLLADL
ncbi:lactonase family protein [Pseudactinotalea sp. Z1748]|uniref:lactonase family protein n=1 Tax=Pseudactinotalea sp. Z1748 TaxID=3413027 RepID=UPI003C79F954